MAPSLEWKKSNFGNGHSIWARPEPDLEYAIDLFSHHVDPEIFLNVTAEGESILFEKVSTVDAGKRLAQKHFNEVRG